MQCAVIIPARGGSKGLPGKNLARVGGRSLIARAVDAAVTAATVDRVVVTTDDDAIETEARAAGAEVVRRPDDLASDISSSEDAVLHAAAEIGLADDDVIAFLQCTSPFIQGPDIDRTVRAVVDHGADTAHTGVAFHGFVWLVDDDGIATGSNHDQRERLRRQDRPRELLEDGAVYVMTLGGLRTHHHRFHGRTVMVERDPRTLMEIDDPPDLERARALAPIVDRLDTNRGGPTRAPALVALDFDGVFTDNRVLVADDGTESVVCHRGDGHGLASLRRHVPVVVFSTEANPVVTRRCEKLGIEAVQGLGDRKVEAVRSWCRDHDIGLADVLFVGNDVNDLETMAAVGIPVAVADAVPEVLRAATWVLGRSGGDGALRELSDELSLMFNDTTDRT